MQTVLIDATCSSSYTAAMFVISLRSRFLWTTTRGSQYMTLPCRSDGSSRGCTHACHGRDKSTPKHTLLSWIRSLRTRERTYQAVYAGLSGVKCDFKIEASGCVDTLELNCRTVPFQFLSPQLWRKSELRVYDAVFSAQGLRLRMDLPQLELKQIQMLDGIVLRSGDPGHHKQCTQASLLRRQLDQATACHTCCLPPASYSLSIPCCCDPNLTKRKSLNTCKSP